MLSTASIFLSLLSIATCADVRVVGGTDAPEGKYPYVASLRRSVLSIRTMHFCTGSILNKRWILTAAHCLEGKLHDSVIVVLNTTDNQGPDGDHYKSVYLVFNKYFSTITLLQNDIGMVKVHREIEFSDRVQPVALPTADFRKDDYPAIFTGWGVTSVGGKETSETLQQIQLTIIASSKCKREILGIPITSSHICTLNDVGEGICYGDSGGPLVVDGVQIGIASFVKLGCAQGYPDVFTRVYTFLDWIKVEQNNERRHDENFVLHHTLSFLKFLFRI